MHQKNALGQRAQLIYGDTSCLRIHVATFPYPPYFRRTARTIIYFQWHSTKPNHIIVGLTGAVSFIITQNSPLPT